MPKYFAPFCYLTISHINGEFPCQRPNRRMEGSLTSLSCFSGDQPVALKENGLSASEV